MRRGKKWIRLIIARIGIEPILTKPCSEFINLPPGQSGRPFFRRQTTMCEFKEKFKNPLTFWKIAEKYLCESLSSQMKAWFSQHIQECEECQRRMKFRCMVEGTPRGVWEAAMMGMAERRVLADRRAKERRTSDNKPVLVGNAAPEETHAEN